MTRLGLNITILLYLRDDRHLNFDDSLIEVVQSSVTNEPIYFNYFPNIYISLRETYKDGLLVLNTKFHGYNMILGSIPIVITYRIEYKLYNSKTQGF